MAEIPRVEAIRRNRLGQSEKMQNRVQSSIFFERIDLPVRLASKPSMKKISVVVSRHVREQQDSRLSDHIVTVNKIAQPAIQVRNAPAEGRSTPSLVNAFRINFSAAANKPRSVTLYAWASAAHRQKSGSIP